MSKESQNYSVLMSVYYKEKPQYLKEAMLSILHQTCPTDNFVLMCDGPLGQDLDTVIGEMQEVFGDILQVHRLSENQGLGNALNEGLKYCRNDLVARMDSDDISIPDRCELQVDRFLKCKNLSIISGTVLEFYESTDKITGKRSLPRRNRDIRKYSKKRNPFNHPAVMFRKTAVLSAGGYSEKYPLFEDYYLWIKMLQNGAIGCNLQKPLVYMRTMPDMYMRRGGAKYALNMIRFHWWLLSVRWTNILDFISGAVPHACVCILPNRIRGSIYRVLHR